MAPAGIVPVGAKVIDPAHIGYFPPDWAVTTVSGDTLTASFSDVQNVNDGPTMVQVELSFATTKGTSPTPAGEHTIEASIGGVTIPQADMKIIVVDNASPEQISGVAKEFGWADELYKYGQAGLDLEVTVPGESDIGLRMLATDVDLV